MAPAGDLFGSFVGRHGRLHDAAGAVDVNDVARVHAQRNAAGPGRAQTAHLVVARNADGRADQVALKLHQVRIARGTAINTKLGKRRARILDHRIDHVENLVGDRLIGRLYEFRAARGACHAKDAALGIARPVRRAQASERRHKVDAARRIGGVAQVGDFLGIVDELQVVA